MIGPDLSVFFSRSIDPVQELYNDASGGSTWVTGESNPLGGEGALRFTDQSGSMSVRILGLLEQLETTQFRISMRAYNNFFVEGGTRGARLRFGVNEVGLMTSEARTAATITFKQDNTIQAKGDLPDDPGALLALPIELQTAYDVDIIVNVDRTNNFVYNYYESEMTLGPAAYHVMVNGALLPEMPATGLPFALTSGSDYAGWTESFGGAVDQIGFVSATADTGVDWYFADMVYATGADISIEGSGGGDTWAGYPIVNGTLVDTGAFLGWLHIEHAPWVYSYELTAWIYIDEAQVGAMGGWTFLPR